MDFRLGLGMLLILLVGNSGWYIAQSPGVEVKLKS